LKKKSKGVTVFCQAHFIDHAIDVYKNPIYKPYPNFLERRKTLITKENESSRTDQKSEFMHLYLQEISLEAFTHGICKSIAQTHDYIVPLLFRPLYDFRMIEWPRGHKLSPNVNNENFGKWFERITGLSFIHDLKWFLGGIFAVQNERITKNTKDYYLGLLKEFDDKSSNSEVSHFFERAWFYIFIK
jgi:hypothetical protein